MPILSDKFYPQKLELNIAIVGGGRTCKFLLELLKNESFPYLNIHLVGVCDINPEAEGLLMARQMGIYTTDNFKDLFNIKHPTSNIEHPTKNKEQRTKNKEQRTKKFECRSIERSGSIGR